MFNTYFTNFILEAEGKNVSVFLYNKEPEV